MMNAKELRSQENLKDTFINPDETLAERAFDFALKQKKKKRKEKHV